MTAARLAALSLLALLGACASNLPFSSSFPNGGDRFASALTRAKSTGSPGEQPVLVGVVDQPRALFAYDLAAGRELFRVPSAATGVPIAAGELIVGVEGEQAVVRRLRDGTIVHQLPLAGMHLVGAAGDTSLVAIVLSTGGALKPRSRLVLLQGERISSDAALDKTLGAPAVLGGLAFVPHQRVHMSIVDAAGRELGRARIRDDVASSAFRYRGEVYFGQRGVYLLDQQSELGPNGGAHYFRPELKRKLPGGPAFLPDTSAPAAPLESALHRVSLSFLPTSDAALKGGLGLEDQALYLTYYRQIFALSPDAYGARWVHETESDVVDVRALDNGLLVVESSGQITMLDENGQISRQLQLPAAPLGASIRADHLELAPPQAEAEAITVQLARAARNPDARLVPARAFAAALLAAVDDDQAAIALIELCADAAAPARVRDDACEALASRSQQSEAVVAALGEHANFLEGTQAPPIGALARAAAHSTDPRTAPGLLSQLHDPSTPADALPLIMRALSVVAGTNGAPSLAAYLRLYHAESSDELEPALIAAMDALIALDPTRARGVLEPIANDAFATSEVRAAARKRLAGLGPAPHAEGEPAEPKSAAGDGEQTETSPLPSKPEGPPTHLTTQHVDEALAPLRVTLSRCVREAKERPASARLVLVIDGRGELVDLRTLPQSVRACVEPIVRSAKFPVTKYGRRSIMSYTISR
jgi:hypothetical protein